MHSLQPFGEHLIFNFNDYIKGAAPWIVTSWSAFIGMWLCFLYAILSCPNTITTFIGFQWPQVDAILIIGGLLSLFTTYYSIALKVCGYILEVNIVNGTRKYESRLSAGFFNVFCISYYKWIPEGRPRYAH
jgi:hypothetical protein